jgi:hypothetical protein
VPAHLTPPPSAAHRDDRDFQSALGRATEACTRAPENCRAATDEVRRLADGNVEHGDQIATLEAAARVEVHDADGALEILDARVAIAGDWQRSLNLHDLRLFVCELKRDVVCAQMEAEEMLRTVESGPGRFEPRARQGAYWQRAHTLRVLAESLGGNRASAIVYARRARDVFAELANASKHALHSITLLDQESAALDGDCRKALSLARTLPEANLDPQDLYNTSVVYERCDDPMGASRLRQLVLQSRSFDLFTNVYRKLAAKMTK